MIVRLWIGIAALIAYGSLYPFKFIHRHFDERLLERFLDTCCTPSVSMADIFGNILLFFPFGYLAILAFPETKSLQMRCLYATLLGGGLALALQIAQIYLPARDANLQDTFWNIVGVWSGIIIGHSSRGFVARLAQETSKPFIIPSILLLGWFLYWTIPIVPTFDLEQILQSLEPLLERPVLVSAFIFHDCLGWLLAAYLLRQALPDTKLKIRLPLIIFVIFALEILALGNFITASNVTGAVLAIILWWAVFARLGKSQGIVLLVLLVAMLAVTGMYPFIARIQPTAFNWLPFHGFLHGSMQISAQSAARKLFLYGSLVYLIWQLNFRLITAVLLAITPIALIEITQIFYTRHTPEVTDPLLVLLASFAIFGLHRPKSPGEPKQNHPMPPEESLRLPVR